ncbi:hypothetical protein PMAYCL1PPCAC_32551, partial [Pristionchus mayeri]
MSSIRHGSLLYKGRNYLEFFASDEERPRVPRPKCRKSALPVIKDDAGAGSSTSGVEKKDEVEIEPDFTSEAGSSYELEDERAKKCKSNEELKALEDRRSTRMKSRSKSSTPEPPDMRDQADDDGIPITDGNLDISFEDDDDEAEMNNSPSKEPPKKRTRETTPPEAGMEGDAQAGSGKETIVLAETGEASRTDSASPVLPAIAPPPAKRRRGRPKKADNERENT